MHHRQTIQTIAQVFATADRLGVTMPKPLADEYASLSRLTEQVRDLDPANDLPAAVLTALEAGNDPERDPEVQRAATRHTIIQFANGIEDALARRAEAFLTEHADELLIPFAKPFDAAAKTLTAAADQLGDVDLDDTAGVIARGGDAAKVWADAHAAGSAIGEIRQLWKMLSNLTGAFKVQPRYQALVIADIDAATFVGEQISGPLAPWAIAQRGYPLSLATPSTIRDRVDAVQAEIERREAKAATAFRDEYRRLRGSGVA